jgi:superfamily I DNA/RNA helicase
LFFRLISPYVLSLSLFQKSNTSPIFFDPAEEQEQAKVPLLYTAITRSQQNLTVYNADSKLSQFGEMAILENYVERHNIVSEYIFF